ncbi:11535_t:CDS:2 [Dentiscutata heterogama]|uniref:11535_t:CDS:1 n=1 Tax=Dentiscutata heterogama TaxID=1316150 RepID=A0ACA9JVC6_9GLOM|nr:11535_t:CDS:2 [Dentiscutata heterogama]
MDGSFFTQIGFIPKYDTYHYIESSIQIIQYATMLASPNFYAGVYIFPWTTAVQIEKEYRNRTFTEIIANMSALYGLMLGLYLFLFRKELHSSEPYGLIYRYYNKSDEKKDFEVDEK